MLKEIKHHTSPGTNFHTTFKYIIGQDVKKRSASILSQKHGMLSNIKLKDLEVTGEMLPVNELKETLELRLKELEKNERGLTRLVMNYKKNYEKPTNPWSVTASGKDLTSSMKLNTNHVNRIPNLRRRK